MVTDSQRLTPRNTLSTARSSLNLGLLYSLPLLLWAAGQVNLPPGGSAAVADIAWRCTQVLLLVQSIALAIVAPWYAWEKRWQDGLTGLLIVALVPLPLFSVIWLIGAVEAPTLVVAQAWLAGLVTLLLSLGKLFAHVVPSGASSTVAATALQICTVAAAWLLRHDWLAWIGL